MSHPSCRFPMEARGGERLTYGPNTAEVEALIGVCGRLSDDEKGALGRAYLAHEKNHTRQAIGRAHIDTEQAAAIASARQASSVRRLPIRDMVIR